MNNNIVIEYANESIAKFYRDSSSSSSPRYYDLVILIIASHNTEHEVIFTQYWKKYMNLYPNVKSYFLYGNETINHDLYISEDSITYKCKEDYVPGISLKTFAAFEFISKKLEYKYVLRTNLSSVFHIPRLLNYLNKAPSNDFICGRVSIIYDKNIDFGNGERRIYYDISQKFLSKKKIQINILSFIDGAGYIFSNDIVTKLLNIYKNDSSIHEILMLPDDIFSSLLLYIVKYKYLYTEYIKIEIPFLEIVDGFINNFTECNKLEDPSKYSENIIHIRNRTDIMYGDRKIDIENMKRQIELFYPCVNISL
jgi:hypothetical protein